MDFYIFCNDFSHYPCWEVGEYREEIGQKEGQRKCPKIRYKNKEIEKIYMYMTGKAEKEGLKLQTILTASTLSI